MLRAEYQAEKGTLEGFGDGAPYAHALMDRDRKSTGLKMLKASSGRTATAAAS